MSGRPVVLEAESLPEGWSYVFDDSSPTCRLLDAPYDAETSQHYVLDGFIVSPNMEVLERGDPETWASSIPTTTPWSWR